MIADPGPSSPPPFAGPPPPLSSGWVTALDITALLVTLLLIVTVQVGADGPVRVLLALSFVTFVPGWALLDHLPLSGTGTARLALAVALSLTIVVTTTLGLIWLDLWRPVALLDLLGALSVAAILAHVSRAEPTRPASVREHDLILDDGAR